MSFSSQHAPLSSSANPQRVAWLVPLVFAINLAGLAMVAAYSLLNLRPDLPASQGPDRFVFLQVSLLLAVVGPTLATVFRILPMWRWLRAGDRLTQRDVPVDIARRAADAPRALAAFTLAGWGLVTLAAIARSLWAGSAMAPGVALHFAMRPLFAGLVVATGTFFATEFVCRTQVWPTLLAGARIAGNGALWRVRIAHRLLVLWLAISALPLAAIALITFALVVGLDLHADPLLGRVVSVVLFVAVTAAIGGAWLAWLFSRSIARPLELLETAMARLRDGTLDAPMAVQSTDEIGAVTEGFNLMAQRLSRTHAELLARNQDLTLALERVVFLEHVKHALNHFVPETVRHAIEADPAGLNLVKKPMDVTVLFLDIEGYSTLSELLPRPALNAMVEHYFSLFLTSIRAHGGDINETAGDGLMILFHAGDTGGHAAAALQAALAMQAQTQLANREASAARPALRINIGISTGECDVGTTRFQGPAGERWTFTASGTVTNLAARLSAHASGGQILLSEETVKRLAGRFPLRSLGTVRLRNLSHALPVWQALLATPPPAAADASA